MKSLPINRILLLKIFGFLILVQTTLFSENVYYVSNTDSSSVNAKVVNHSVNKERVEVEEVGLDSFGGVSIMLIIGLTSLLGAFFVRDEFSELMD